jgi:hypothetical protein
MCFSDLHSYVLEPVINIIPLDYSSNKSPKKTLQQQADHVSLNINHDDIGRRTLKHHHVPALAGARYIMYQHAAFTMEGQQLVHFI